MNLLILDNAPVDKWFQELLKLSYPNAHVMGMHPDVSESMQLFLDRAIKTIGKMMPIIAINANLRLCDKGRRQLAGLTALEKLMKEITVPAIIYSFLRNPIHYLADDRLKDDRENILLDHQSIVQIQFPCNLIDFQNAIKRVSQYAA